MDHWDVVLGKTQMGSSGGVSVERIIIHSNYKPAVNDYDIALMQLSKPVETGGGLSYRRQNVSEVIFE